MPRVQRHGQGEDVSQQLDRSVRAYVARGTGLDMNLVRPGNAKGQRPKAPYATLLPVSDLRTGAPQYRQQVDAAGRAAGTLTETPYRRTYSLQFYRAGALDLANAFDRWAASEDGLIVADTSFASYGGGIRRIRVRDAGSYSDTPRVVITGPGGSGATAEAELAPGTGRRPVQGIGITAAGGDYVGPTVTLESDDAGDTAGVAMAYGWGFQVDHPLTVRRLDSIIGDAFEERGQIDLPVLYTTLDLQDTGGVDTWECELVVGGSGVVLTG